MLVSSSMFCCKVRPKSDITSLLTETFLNQWSLKSKQSIDSCLRTGSTLSNWDGMAYDILINDRNMQLRSKFFQALVNEKGDDFVAGKLTIVENYNRSTHHEVARSYSAVIIWFDNSDLGRIYLFNPQTDQFEIQDGEHLKQNNIFFDEDESSECCYTFYNSSFLGSKYLSVFEVSDTGQFELVNFCLRVYDIRLAN